jgi:glycyl-tRNA synthetase beta chain
LPPTGSADPYALRRQAFGIVRITLERQFPLDLEKAAQLALKLQPISLDEARFHEVLIQMQDFLWGRAQSFFEEKGFALDEIRSVKIHALKNLSRTYLRLSAVKSARLAKDFEPLAMSFKRASNILRQARYEDGDDVFAVDRLIEPAETALCDVLAELERGLNDKIVVDDFEGALKSLATVKPYLDLFFEKVMVMVENPDLKRARLQLLAKLVNQVADLSEIQGASSK